MAHGLMDWETLESDQIDQIMKGDKHRPTSSGEGDGGSRSSDDDGQQTERPDIKPNMDSPAGDSA